MARTIRGVAISWELIDAIQRLSSPSLTTLTETLGYSKSTVYSHLRTLDEQQVVVQDGDGYRLSLRFLAIANTVKEQVGPYEVIREEVRRLADTTGEVAQFAIGEHNRAVYLCKEKGETAVETASRVGTGQPLHSTALGRCLLATRPPAAREEIVTALDLTPETAHTITDPETLLAACRDVAQRGYAVDDEENVSGLRCVAAPVHVPDGLRGAISVSGPVERLPADRVETDIASAVTRSANIIELNAQHDSRA
jgi:IclR family KDG regulon transcriptional repressor